MIPSDFMFELTKEEWHSLRCSFSTLNGGRGQHPKYMPFAFTELGVAMLSSVLNSEDTRMQLELINQTLAELQIKNKVTGERKRIGYQLPGCNNK